MGEAADSVERMYTHNLMWGATSYVWVESIRAVDDNVGLSLNSNNKTNNTFYFSLFMNALPLTFIPINLPIFWKRLKVKIWVLL